MAIPGDRFSGPLRWLIGANALLFLIVWGITLIGNAQGAGGNFTMPWLCVPSDPLLAPQRPWTLFTYMFTQYGFLHLLFNMLWLFWFGEILSSESGPRAIISTYIGGGVAGALLYVLTSLLFPALPAPGACLCGASAAVLSVMTAAALRAPGMPVNLLLIGRVKLKWVALACILLTFAGTGGGNAMAQSAHVGGVLFGWLYWLARKRNLSLTKPAALPQRPGRYKPPQRNVHRDGEAVARIMQDQEGDAQRLDQLLDKIHNSGYQSLTRAEKAELNLLSARLFK